MIVIIITYWELLFTVRTISNSWKKARNKNEELDITQDIYIKMHENLRFHEGKSNTRANRSIKGDYIN